VEYSIIAPKASRSLLLDGMTVEGLTVVVGDRGHILVSRDQGGTWTQARVPTRSMLTGVFLHEKKLGWAVGHDAVILRTEDGAETWERVHWAPEEERPLLDVWFEDAENGLAIGAYGYVLATSDGGKTWSERSIVEGDEAAAGGATEDYGADEDWDVDFDYEAEEWGVVGDYHLNQIARAENGRMYIAAEAGAVFRSDDNGRTWVSLTSPYQGSFFGVLPLAGDSVLVFGLRGHMYRSDDAGQTWRELETGIEEMLTAGLRLNDATVLVAGLGGKILVSHDGGDTFLVRQRPDRQGLAAILETDDGALLLIGEYGANRLAASEIAVAETP
jgi:photosystem II stability/assembly factor-like uncharacterized protein